jgi:hypothetical protein
MEELKKAKYFIEEAVEYCDDLLRRLEPDSVNHSSLGVAMDKLRVAKGIVETVNRSLSGSD